MSGFALSYRSRSYFTNDGRSVSMFWCQAHSGTCDQILLPVGMLLSECCELVSVRRPLWSEDESAISSTITQSSESLRTRNHTLLSHLRLPQPEEQSSRIYIPQEQSGPVILLGTEFSFRRRATVEVYYPPPSLDGQVSAHIYLSGTTTVQSQKSKVKSQSHVTTDGHSISISWCPVHAAL
jgi:hypothetical protein